MARDARTIVLAEDEAATWSASGALRWTGVAALALALAAGPLAMGSVRPWAWTGLWGLAAISVLATLAVWIVEGRATLVFAPFAAIPALIAVVAAVQLIPIPSGFFRFAGGRTHEIHGILGYGSALWRGSLEPSGTLDAFLKAILMFMACIGALALPRTRPMLFTLVGAVCAAVAFTSVAGIIQENGSTERIYGLIDLTPHLQGETLRSAALEPALSSGVGRLESFNIGRAVFFRYSCGLPDVFGPYLNSNHFAGLVEISLPVLLAVFVGLVRTQRGGWRALRGFTGSSQGRIAALLGFIIALGTGAIVYAHSFAGLGGLAVGLAAVGAALCRTRRAIAVLAAAGLVLAIVALGTALALRPNVFGMLPEILEAKFAGRRDIWAATAAAARDFPLTGSGLGSFASVIGRYESTETKHFFAHNDYLQLALEAGLPAAAGVFALAAWQARRLAKAAAKNADAQCGVLSAGAFGSCAAMAFHSFFDFNLHVPANAVALTVTICAGAVAARATRLTSGGLGFAHTVVLTGRRGLVLVAAAAVAAIAAAGVSAAGTVRADFAGGEAREAIAGLPGTTTPQSAQDLARAYAGVVRARGLRHLDGELRYQAAALAAALSQLETDPSKASRLGEDSLRDAMAAARLSPACTFAALTVLSMGAEDGGVSRRWPISSFDYRREVARQIFERGENGDGLKWTREALALASAYRSELARQTNAVIAQLVKRFGTYDRISAAAPDTFAGHLVFAGGLEAAGLAAAASEEYALAAGRALSAPGGAGLSQRPVAEVAEALSSEGRTDAALELLRAVLERHKHWQYLRLSYARLLARAGRAEDAASQIEVILSSHTADWLRRDASLLQQSMAKQ